MIELPVLDDKRYRQILDEAVARIPTLTGQWTDFNPQDTGIMLLELLAAMTEMQNFYLDQVGERFYEKYLALMTAPVCGETTADRALRFARQSAQSDVAVTAADYERLVLQAPFAIDRARAAVRDGVIELTVFRASCPLEERELDRLRAWLEPYRLLTARLRFAQARCLEVDVVCRVVMDAKRGRESVCRKNLETLFRRFMREKALEETINFGDIRSEILAMPEILRIESLSIRGDGRELQGVRQENTLTQVRELKMELLEA